MEYTRLISEAKAVLWAWLKDTYIDADDEDDWMDQEKCIYKVDYVRTAIKKSIRTNAHKLINKAKVNIQAVEKGFFGLGLYAMSSITFDNLRAWLGENTKALWLLVYWYA